MSRPEPATGKTPLVLVALWLLVAAAGLAVWAVTLPCNPPQAWRALLVNFLFFTPLAAGLVTWSPIVLLSHGKWPGDLERLTGAGSAFAVPSVSALALLWYGGPAWAPWYAKGLHQGLWLRPSVVFARDLVLLALFWILALYYQKRRLLGEGRITGAWMIIAYCCVFSLLGFDLVMGLDTEWYSSLLGGYFFISGLYIAVCGWTLLAIVTGGRDPNRLHDLGRLILAFSILTTYLMFSQLIPIWYENLPKEIHYLVPRVNFRPWSLVSWTLLAVVWLGPLIMLLTIRAKRSPWLLGPITLLIMSGLWVERWWLVAPTFQRTLNFGWSEVSMFCALLGLFAVGATWTLRRGAAAQPGEGGQT